MSQQDLVSILIPAYKSDFFEQALLSAMAQDWQNTEIIVCDDSENDSIRIICERLSQAQKSLCAGSETANAYWKPAMYYIVSATQKENMLSSFMMMMF